ncbi:golgin subfamily A member 1-like isoform X2 [Limulus polyphemus]|uniref:Golgin subfamily A member 1-like isoform X2 n=1 Tax=Limulus polyphemus TaxID=6850 RepID=A0ABM1STW9_LIMPO|nr:golgin subfamily A member 1-like isoform X2 [Limulus polyphemus]
MFAKLKKKLEEENPGELPKVLTATGSASNIAALSSSLSGSANNMSVVGKSSISSSNTTPSCSQKESGRWHVDSREEFGSYQEKTEPVKLLESKVKELQEQLEEKKEELKANQAVAMEKLKQALSQKDADWIIKVQALEKERLRLEDKLQESQVKLQKFIEKQEDKDELQNFQNQEMSKIKHLLLISQQQVRSLEDKLKEQNEEVSQAHKKVKDMEDIANQLQVQVERGDKELSKVRKMEHDKAELELEVDRLKQEALQSANRMGHLELTLSDLTDEHDALIHTHQLYKSKTSSILEEKDSYIVHLEERVTILEKRLEDSSLPNDEKVQSLLSERERLEKKLEESRQHLSEVKSTWSEKINSLETQIFHLNKKMGEDSEECTKLEKQVCEFQQKLKEKEEEVWSLDEKVQEKDQTLARLRIQNEEEVKKIILESQIKQQELNSLISQLESDLSKTMEEREKENDEAHRRINELVAAQTEYVEKEIEVERQMTFLEDENTKLKGELGKKEKECITLCQNVQSHREEYNTMTATVQELEEKITSHLSSLEDLQQVLKEREVELRSTTQEKDNLMMRSTEYSNQLELLRQELGEEKMLREKAKEEGDKTIGELRVELQATKEKITELEKQVTENVENSTRVSELKSVVEDLEVQLIEKNKLQQQRLTDMKKTLQKELRVQRNIDGFQTSDTMEIGSSSSSHINVRGFQDCGHQQNHLDLNNDDDVNFKYLKHVVFKFMTCREYEAQHLIRAVSVLLHFNPEEERLIKETLNWKMSWFGTKPELPKGRLKTSYARGLYLCRMFTQGQAW